MKACDIFSTGVVLWNMLNGSGEWPFATASFDDQSYKYLYNHGQKNNDQELRDYKAFWRQNDKCVMMKYDDILSIQDLFLKIFGILYVS